MWPHVLAVFHEFSGSNALPATLNFFPSQFQSPRDAKPDAGRHTTGLKPLDFSKSGIHSGSGPTHPSTNPVD
jgi:hypothetical protein